MDVFGFFWDWVSSKPLSKESPLSHLMLANSMRGRMPNIKDYHAQGPVLILLVICLSVVPTIHEIIFKSPCIRTVYIRLMMAGWHHGLNGHESEWTPGDGDGQGGLACCDSWGRKESDTTERLNWTELNWTLMWRLREILHRYPFSYKENFICFSLQNSRVGQVIWKENRNMSDETVQEGSM